MSSHEQSFREDHERREFEAWGAEMMRWGGAGENEVAAKFMRHRVGPLFGEYVDMEAEARWQAWKARASLNPPPADAKPDAFPIMPAGCFKCGCAVTTIPHTVYALCRRCDGPDAEPKPDALPAVEEIAAVVLPMLAARDDYGDERVANTIAQDVRQLCRIAKPKPDAVAEARDEIVRAARALLIHEQDSVYAGRGRIYKCPNCAARGEKGADGGWVTPIVHTNFVASDVRCPWGLLHDAFLATEQAEREAGGGA